MKKILVIAEKPSVAKSCAEYLENMKMQSGYYEGNRYIVTWALGHIVSRKELYEYDPNINRRLSNREHVLNTLPYFPKEHILKPGYINTEFIKDKTQLANAKHHNEGIKERLTTISNLFKRDDIECVVNACDAGREGELIASLIFDYLKCPHPKKRVWLSSFTENSVKNEFKNLKNASEYDNLRQAAYSRAELDWEHNLNLSALYASLYNTTLSIGRVQTPTLNMIVEREHEILAFNPEDYYLLDANFSTKDNFKYKGRIVLDDTLKSLAEDGKIKDVSVINNIISKMENKEGFIKSIDKKKKTDQAKMLYDLTELQKDMNRRYKMSADTVLSIAQKLYEVHKITTYPRTNSAYLEDDSRDMAFERLGELPRQYDEFVNVAKSYGKVIEKIFNSSKVEDHTAIIPTEYARDFDLTKLSSSEKIVFDAICKRYISVFMPPHEYESTTLITTVEGFNFKTTGKKIVNMGWKSLYSKEDVDNSKKTDEDADQDLSHNFNNGDAVLVNKIEKLAKKTTPPPRFTDATLLAAMELGGTKNATIEDQDKIDILKERGLGTPATRAGILKRIVDVGYCNRDAKTSQFIPTEKGMDFISKIKIEVLKSPEITGEWEQKLRKIERGQISRNTVMEEARNFVRECVEKIKDSYSEGDMIQNFSTLNVICPDCGGKIRKYSNMYQCENNKKLCGFSTPISICGKTIKDSDIEDVCAKGRTKVIKGFKTAKKGPDKKPLMENGKPVIVKFDASLVYDKTEKKFKFDFGNGTPKEKTETEFICPICKKPIMEYANNYGCSGFKDGCKISTFKTIGDKKLSKSDLSDLFTKGETKVFTGLHHPKNLNREFNAKLLIHNGQVQTIIVDENGEAVKKAEGKQTKYFCPICKKTILDFDTYFKCSGDKCGFSVARVIAKTTLSNDDLDEVFIKGETSNYLPFTSNKGISFNAKLKINKKKKKLDFDFETRK